MENSSEEVSSITPKQKIYYLLTEYLAGQYKTDTFCDEFNQMYTFELRCDNSLSSKEHELFWELLVITSRFSPFADDLTKSRVYYSEEEVQSKAYEVYNKLG